MTHVNAYYGAVEEAKQGVAEAEGKLVAALKALHEHPDYVEPMDVDEVEEPVSEEASVGVTVTSTLSSSNMPVFTDGSADEVDEPLEADDSKE